MIHAKVQKSLSPLTGETYFYAYPINEGYVDFDSLADDISRECTLTSHDLKAAFSALEEQIITALKNGKSVRLGDLGSFRATFASKGTKNAEDFNISNIRRVKVTFSKSRKMISAFKNVKSLVRIVKQEKV